MKSRWSCDHSLCGIRESIYPTHFKACHIVDLRPHEQDLVTLLVRNVGVELDISPGKANPSIGQHTLSHILDRNIGQTSDDAIDVLETELNAVLVGAPPLFS
jgi:hypothetical protein